MLKILDKNQNERINKFLLIIEKDNPDKEILMIQEKLKNITREKIILRNANLKVALYDIEESSPNLEYGDMIEEHGTKKHITISRSLNPIDFIRIIYEKILGYIGAPEI